VQAAPPVPDPVLAPPPAAAPAPPLVPAPALAPADLLPASPAAALDVAAPLGAAPPAVKVEPDAVPTRDSSTVAAPAPAGWLDLGTALVLVIAALTWQFLSHYARHQLPDLEASGTELANFDRVVGALPLADTAAGPVLGALLAVGGLAILMRSIRSGEREPVLQGAVGAIATISIVLTLVLGRLAG
jgi:hypothetical protein